jgi:hypothetical protein
VSYWVSGNIGFQRQGSFYCTAIRKIPDAVTRLVLILIGERHEMLDVNDLPAIDPVHVIEGLD